MSPGKGEGSWGTIEGILGCRPEPYMLWSDGREERVTNLKKAEKRRKKRLEKGKSTFVIVYKQPDCYQPAWTSINHVVNKPKFALVGEASIVGRAVILQGNEGKEDKGIACCTLELVKEEA